MTANNEAVRNLRIRLAAAERDRDVLRKRCADFCAAARVILPMVDPQHQTEYMRTLVREHESAEARRKRDD